MKFPEEFLHFIWQFRLYGSLKLYTTSGEAIEVIRTGSLNKNSGPDFLHAKLVIDKTIWIGNIEIHIHSSDWLVHQHQHDTAYDNVILHVVYVNDEPIYRTDGTQIPTLILKDCFPVKFLIHYEQLIQSTNHFPCQKQVHSIDSFFINSFLTRVGIERLAQKSEEVYEKLNELKGNWDETFYHFMARNFGLKLNAMPMEMLSRALPQQILAKHKDNPFQIEALLFGQAGFLEQKFTDAYPQQLKQEFQFLKHKYNLKPLSVSLWKFMRMRPQNFPTLRLAQFAALVVNSNHLFSKIVVIKEYGKIAQLFDALPVDPFWETHYHFHKEAENVRVQLGKGTIQNILINTISLFLFAYGKYIDQQALIDRALALLEYLPSEHNVIIKQYCDAGVKVNTAFISQALLQLKKNYCNEKKCLNCGIGIKILNK
ncbi:DUF2851 family protein [Pedobacter sp. Du54]|uniref:DUF2851 family protein n=1 Tax=Pedobacter anseongensis TaxID=3133439 RepID=UPI0030A519D6